MQYLFSHADILLRSKAGDYTVLPDAYLGVEGESICYIGKDRPAEPCRQEKLMRGKLLMPGLVNCHTHAAMTLLRGVGSGLPLHAWLFDAIFPVEDKLDAEAAAVGLDLAMLEMLSTGTTSFSDMYFFPAQTTERILKAGMKANVCRVVQSFDPAELPENNRSIAQSLELWETMHGAGNGRIRVDFCIHAEYTCQSRIVEAYSRLCREKGGRMHLHLSETAAEQEKCIETYGKTPARWFADLGTFDSPTAAAHCVVVTEEDMAILKDKGVRVVHNPSSNMKLGSGFAPIPRMLELGIPVALGTDGAASNNNLNLWEELHLAALLHKGYGNDPTCLTPEQLLDMATVVGAQLQGRDDTGVLAVGKKADVIALDETKPHLQPNLDTLALLCYSVQGSDVCMTMVDGQILYENGQFYTLDPDEIYRQVQAVLPKLYGKEAQ